MVRCTLWILRCVKRGVQSALRDRLYFFFCVFGAWICFGLRMIALSGLMVKNMYIVCMSVRNNKKKIKRNIWAKEYD